jgi:hypothetical protein
MKRRQFFTVTAAVMAATSSLLGGCATYGLSQAIKQKEYSYYKETLRQVLITQDDKSIVIIGARHHYIVDAPASLVQAIRSGLHAQMRASFGTFGVDRDANLSGVIVLTLGADATQEECEQAELLGFKVPATPGGDVQRVRKYYLQGKRYDAGDFQLPSQATLLNQSYEVSVRETMPIGGRAALALLTPVAVAADGTLILLAIPLLPVFLAYVYAAEPKLCCW